MKVLITFKHPDALDYAREDIKDSKTLSDFNLIANEYFEYDEYAYIEVDTETGEATLKKHYEV